MFSLDDVVKVEFSETAVQNLHHIFGQCGEIRVIQPYTSGSSSANTQFFIRFADSASAKRALNIKFNNPGIQVLSVVMHPHVIDQYRSINPAAFVVPAQPGTINPEDDRSIVHSLSARAQLRKSTRGFGDNLPLGIQSVPDGAVRRDSETVHAAGIPPTGFLFETLKSSKNPVSNRSEPRTDDSTAASSSSNTSALPSAPHPPPAPISTSRPFSISFPAQPSSQTSSPLSGPVPSPAINPVFSLGTRIALSLCGEVITYDLQSLDSDPQAIIHLLKMTASERGAWMIVGAYYRRAGNARAALAVITAMLEVMIQHGAPEEDLKPAFLMLSGCETDLARHLKATHPNDLAVPEHYRKSQEWLQKVFGIKSIPLQNILGLTIDIANNLPKKPDTAASPTQPHNNLHPNDSKEIHGASIPRAQIFSPSYTLTIEREFRSLRDRHENQSTTLAETRVAKRQLEDDFASERNVRRKLQRQVDDLEQELKTTKRMEAYALEQAKREVETRKRADERAEGERAKRLECERVAEKAAAKPLFEDLANMFQKAAQGERVDFTTLVARAADGSSALVGSV